MLVSGSCQNHTESFSHILKSKRDGMKFHPFSSVFILFPSPHGVSEFLRPCGQQCAWGFHSSGTALHSGAQVFQRPEECYCTSLNPFLYIFLIFVDLSLCRALVSVATVMPTSTLLQSTICLWNARGFSLTRCQAILGGTLGELFVTCCHGSWKNSAKAGCIKHSEDWLGFEWMSNSKSPKAPCLGTNFTIGSCSKVWERFHMSAPLGGHGESCFTFRCLCQSPPQLQLPGTISILMKRIGHDWSLASWISSKSSMYHQQFQPSEFWESLICAIHK